MNKDEEWIWPAVIVIVAWLFYQASKAQSAASIASSQATVAQSNNPWLAAAGGIGVLGSTISAFSNLFQSSD
jgi:hypothetical protein